MIRLNAARELEAPRREVAKSSGPGTVAGPLSLALPRLFDKPRRLLAERRLKQDLARLLATAKNHQANGLAPGAAAYRELHQNCGQAIKSYCDRFDQSFKSVAIQFPALYGLEKVAYPERAPKTRSPWLLMAVVVAVAVLAFAALLGTASGVYQAAQKVFAR